VTHHATALNLASVLEHNARLQPDRVALTFQDSSVTYGELNARASQLASGLATLGIGHGERIALTCPNVPWFPIAYYAILKCGAIVVPLNVLLKPREIAYHLRDSGASAMIAFEGTPELPMAQWAAEACADAGCAHLIVAPCDPAKPPSLDVAGLKPAPTSIVNVMAAGQRHFDTWRHRPDDTAVILYTSGTTGHPKGAELTHANMVSNAVTTYDMLRPAGAAGLQQDVCLVTLPLFHSTAQTCQMNAGLYGGYRLVLLPRFDPAAVLETIARERVTFWIAVPTMYWAMLDRVAKGDLDTSEAAKHLRVCVSGGAPMPATVMRRFEETFGVRVLEGYGLSETAPAVSFNQLQRPSKPGTVGLPIFGVDVRCVDEQGRPVPTGERGEVVVRGPNVMKGYYNRPEATDDAMRNGWFHTGDIGTLDADGYLSIVDRKKDLILRGGFNVYPREIEEEMMTHAAVAQVAVIGVPDERLGEEIKAVVVRKPGQQIAEQDLIDWCRERMAAYKYPRILEFRDALPMGPTGKILKRALR
jgi:long-chain acyl-CoA synthetase